MQMEYKLWDQSEDGTRYYDIVIDGRSEWATSQSAPTVRTVIREWMRLNQGQLLHGNILLKSEKGEVDPSHSFQFILDPAGRDRIFFRYEIDVDSRLRSNGTLLTDLILDKEVHHVYLSRKICDAQLVIYIKQS